MIWWYHWFTSELILVQWIFQQQCQFQHHFEQHLASSSLPMHQTALTERRRRRRNIDGSGRTTNSGAVLFFDISGFTSSGRKTVLVESAKLVLELKGSGRVGVVQRVDGAGGITLDSVLVKEEGELEMEVRRDFHQEDSLYPLKLFLR